MKKPMPFPKGTKLPKFRAPSRHVIEQLTSFEQRVLNAVLSVIESFKPGTEYIAADIVPSFIWDAEPDSRHRFTGTVLSQFVDRGLLPFKKLDLRSCNWLVYRLDFRA